MKSAALALIAIAGAASSALAVPSFELNKGSFRYTERNIEGAGTALPNGGLFDYGLAGPGGSVINDYGFRNWWHYRIGQTGAETPVRTQTAFQLGINGDTASLRYLEPVSGAGSGRGLQFDFTYTLNEIVPNTSALTTINWTIKNTTDEGLSINFFNLTDFDVGAFSDDEGVYSTAVGFQEQRTNASTTNSADFATLTTNARLADAWQMAGNFIMLPDPELGMYDFGPTNLPSTATPVVGAVRGAFQWVLTLGPGEQAGGVLYKGYNYSVIPAPGAAALLGLGGLLAARRRR